MFNQEMYGYAKGEVNQFLEKTLRRLEDFERTIEMQRNEIQALEKRIEILKVHDVGDEIIEQAKANADKIIYDALLEINDLEDRIQVAIQKELEK